MLRRTEKRDAAKIEADNAAKAENPKAVSAAKSIGIGSPISREENAAIHELNAKLSQHAQLVTAESWEKINGKPFTNWID